MKRVASALPSLVLLACAAAAPQRDAGGDATTAASDARVLDAAGDAGALGPVRRAVARFSTRCAPDRASCGLDIYEAFETTTGRCTYGPDAVDPTLTRLVGSFVGTMGETVQINALYRQHDSGVVAPGDFSVSTTVGTQSNVWSAAPCWDWEFQGGDPGTGRPISVEVQFQCMAHDETAGGSATVSVFGPGTNGGGIVSIDGCVPGL